MNEIVGRFWRKDYLLRSEIESEIEKVEEEVEEMEARDIYQGDSYYQDTLGELSALKECLNSYDDSYDEYGNLLENE